MKTDSENEMIRGKSLTGIHSKALRIAISSRTALCVFLVSAVLLGLLLWRERDRCGSYFTQATIWAPPVLVISSDDWGGIDAPETVEDLDRLCDVLKSVTDVQGNPLVLTVYLNPAEPDFEAITASEYTSYSHRYCYRDKPRVAQRLRELHEAGITDIQFHGREHYNIPLWLGLLQEDRPGFREACVGGRIPWREGPGWNVEADPRLPFLRQSFVDASSYPPKALSIGQQRDMIASGVAMMEAELGISPTVLTPPGYGHDMNTLHAMQHTGMSYIDCVRRAVPQVDPSGSLSDKGARWDYGVEFAGVQAIIRNVHFEPQRTSMSRRRYARLTMRAIRQVLQAGQHVVISSHRWNYIGTENPDRDGDVALLRDLVIRIKHVAPDIVFLSASDLAKHLYEGGVGARRSIGLQSRNLSRAERIAHGVHCCWSGHPRIRAAGLLSAASLLWLCSLAVLHRRRAFH